MRSLFDALSRTDHAAGVDPGDAADAFGPDLDALARLLRLGVVIFLALTLLLIAALA